MVKEVEEVLTIALENFAFSAVPAAEAAVPQKKARVGKVLVTSRKGVSA